MGQKIRTKPDRALFSRHPVEIGGWFDGNRSYLWLGLNGRCIGTISNQKLYRLAKAIVKQFEASYD